jgi:hypothetical protein
MFLDIDRYTITSLILTPNELAERGGRPIEHKK